MEQRYAFRAESEVRGRIMFLSQLPCAGKDVEPIEASEHKLHAAERLRPITEFMYPVGSERRLTKTAQSSPRQGNTIPSPRPAPSIA
jgi:hypothetical protein